jgi:hypothetical protein
MERRCSPVEGHDVVCMVIVLSLGRVDEVRFPFESTFHNETNVYWQFIVTAELKEGLPVSFNSYSGHMNENVQILLSSNFCIEWYSSAKIGRLRNV